MLFIFNVDKEYAFWMKDMHFSIDMVWLSSAKNIVYMAQDISPATFPEDFVPTSPARYVLELPAGYTLDMDSRLGIARHFRQAQICCIMATCAKQSLRDSLQAEESPDSRQ